MRDKYGNASLNDNINSARKAGLITKKQKKALHFIRERFRNAYSHSDKDKTFGDVTVPTQGVKFEDGQLRIVDEGEPLASELFIGHGYFQAVSAEANAADCFLYIDDLVRQIRSKLFPGDNQRDSEPQS